METDLLGVAFYKFIEFNFQVYKQSDSLYVAKRNGYYFLISSRFDGQDKVKIVPALKDKKRVYPKSDMLGFEPKWIPLDKFPFERFALKKKIPVKENDRIEK